MASAGRILIKPRGNWKSETEYEMLDLVFHNGTSWLAKDDSIGIEPEMNSDKWQCLIDINELARLISQNG